MYKQRSKHGNKKYTQKSKQAIETTEKQNKTIKQKSRKEWMT